MRVYCWLLVTVAHRGSTIMCVGEATV